MQRMAACGASPPRQQAQTANTNAATVTGHASYRVRQASANMQPTTLSRSARVITRSINNATPSSVSASSSGSVIGVDCRYSTFGLAAKTIAAKAAARRDAVSADTIHAIAPVATANERIDRATADAPVR